MKRELVIIDDDPIYRLIISKMVNTIDASVIIDECENCEMGLAKMESLGQLDHDVIVLLDINMPKLDGWGFLDEIEKSNILIQPQITIYMVSSSTDESDLLKSKKYKSLRGFFCKPLSKEVLKTIIGID
jgi:CheY-like chemotaxis protein